MKKLFLIAALVISNLAVAQTPNEDEESFPDLSQMPKESLVCLSDKMEDCYLNVWQEENKKINIVEPYNRFKEVKAEGKEINILDLKHIGHVMVMDAAYLDRVLPNFRTVSLRNFAIREPIQHEDGSQEIPFVVEMFWKVSARSGFNGTMQIQGALKVAANNESEEMESEESFNSDEVEEDSNQSITKEQLYEFMKPEIQKIVDSTTEDNLGDTGRQLEKLARNISFQKITLDGQSVDEATMQMAEEIVGPALVADLYYIPLMEALVEMLGKAIADGIQDMLEGALPVQKQEPILNQQRI